MITLYRGDDTGGQLGKNVKIAFHCDDAVDMDGVTVRFNLLDVVAKEWTNVHDGDILEIFVTHEQSGRLPLGLIFGKLWGEDSSGKIRTFANRLPIIVTNDLRKAYGSDGLASQDIHVYSPVDWDAIANKPTLFPSKIELVDGLSEALDGMVKSVNGKTADSAGAITLTLDSFANKDGEIQVKQTLMVSRDGGQTFNAVATFEDLFADIESHNGSLTAHAQLFNGRVPLTRKVNGKQLNADVVLTSADIKTGIDADAQTVNEALAGKLDSGEAILEKDAYGLTDESHVAGFFVRKNGGIFIGTAGGIVEIPYLRPGTMALDVDITDATKLAPVLDADGRVTGYRLGDKASPVLLTDDAKAALFAGADFIAAVKKYGGTQIKEDEKGFYYEVDEEA